MDMLYTHAKFGVDLPLHGGKRGKMGVFCLFVCLFVCLSRLQSVYLWAIGALTVRAVLLPFTGRFWCSFQRFFRGRNVLSNFSKISELHHKMALHLS